MWNLLFRNCKAHQTYTGQRAARKAHKSETSLTPTDLCFVRPLQCTRHRSDPHSWVSISLPRMLWTACPIQRVHLLPSCTSLVRKHLATEKHETVSGKEIQKDKENANMAVNAIMSSRFALRASVDWSLLFSLRNRVVAKKTWPKKNARVFFKAHLKKTIKPTLYFSFEKSANK